jgi:predicted ATPase/DNA-binding winged helix-turn-helix (wHTH) protein
MTAREYAFGRYRLQPGRGLSADGVPVPVGLKALDILAALVGAAGELVTKSELMDRVWPGITVEEHNIQVHISALRKMLGDEADRIVTVPRLGYRFTGLVTVALPAGTDSPHSPLPRPLNRLFGREDDLAAIRASLEHGRLVTLAGPGGIGKTRLGLEIAHGMGSGYRDGAVFVDLSVLQDASLVASLVASAVGVDLRGDTPPADLLARRLKSRELLLLLDNCEHVIDAVAPLAELILAEAPTVTLLATSREPLACVGEQVYRLPLLSIPPDGVNSAAEALAASSIGLLVDRLQAADLHFRLTDATAAAAAAICRRLDGLPLAIEMVGALVPGFGLEATAARLEESFRLPYSVTRTAAPRHRSLEATLDWSHALLSLTDRTMLRRLAVFPGHFSLEAAEAILCDDALGGSACGDVLAGLVRKSLVSIDLAGSPRSYRLLETVRAYAAEKLDAAGERAPLRARHAGFVAGVLKRALADWDATPDRAWLDRYRWLLTDLRVALLWSFEPGGDPSLGLVIVGRSRLLWQQLNLRVEGCRWAEAAITALTPETPDAIAAPAWLALGYLTGERSVQQSILALRRAAELFGRSGGRIEHGTALTVLGQALALSGQTAAAADSLTRARILLGQDAGSRRLGICAMGFGMLYAAAGSWFDARREYELARSLFQAVGAARLAMATLYNLADAMWTEGALDMAIDAKRETLDLARLEGNWDLAGFACGSLAGMLTARGDIDEALAYAREAMPICREAEYVDWLYPHLAMRAAKAGRLEDAARLWGYADRLAKTGSVWQIHEQQAVEALSALLHAAVAPARMEELVAAGWHLGEEQAIAIALA